MRQHALLEEVFLRHVVRIVPRGHCAAGVSGEAVEVKAIAYNNGTEVKMAMSRQEAEFIWRCLGEQSDNSAKKLMAGEIKVGYMYCELSRIFDPFPPVEVNEIPDEPEL